MERHTRWIKNEVWVENRSGLLYRIERSTYQLDRQGNTKEIVAHRSRFLGVAPQVEGT